MQRDPQVVVRGAGLGHHQILTQCASEQVAAGADDRDRARQRLLRNITQFHIRGCAEQRITETNRAVIADQRTAQQTCCRGLAGPGHADNGRQLARLRGEINIMQSNFLVIARAVGESDMVESHRHGIRDRRQTNAAVMRHRGIQQRENALRGRHAVHRHMEIRPQLAQRQEETRRQQRDHQGSRQPDLADHELPNRRANTGRGATVRHQVHRRERAQLDLQHTHGHHAEFLGLAVHVLGRTPVGIEGFQRFQALQVVKERSAHIRVLAPVLLEHAGGAHRDQPHDDDNQRSAHQQHQRGRPIDGGNKDEQGDRCENRIEQLRKEQFEEALDLLNALACGLDHVGGAHALGVGGTQLQHFAVQLLTQGKFDAFADAGAEIGGAAGGHVFHDDDDGDEQDEHAVIVRVRRQGMFAGFECRITLCLRRVEAPADRVELGAFGRVKRLDIPEDVAEQTNQNIGESDIRQQRHP